MDKNEYYNDAEFEDEDDGLDIDWAGLLVKLLNGWKFIAVVTCLAAAVGVGTALLTQKKYTVYVTLAPEAQGRSGGGNLSSITSMLGLGSTSIGSTSDALNITLFPEICQSTQFLTQLFGVLVTPYVSPKQLQEGASEPQPTTLFKYITKEDDEPGLLQRIKESLLGEQEQIPEPDTVNVAQLSPKQRLVVKALRASMGADVDKKTGVATISVTMDDPWIATTLADTVCQRLQRYVIEYRTRKAVTDLNYYEKLAEESKDKMVKAQSAYAASIDFDRSVILQSVNSEKERLQREAQLAAEIYNQMAQQVEMAKAKLQEVKPVFAVIQPATMPERPSSTSRKMVVLVFLFLGFCGATAWKLFGEDLLSQIRNILQMKMEEQSEGKAAESVN